VHDLPSIEMLEAVHIFPGPYVFKAIGRSEDAFVTRVVAAVRAELGLSRDPEYTTRDAAGGRHVAVTFQVRVESAQSVLAVYRRMQTTAGLVMML
jgi:hypothetical protein